MLLCSSCSSGADNSGRLSDEQPLLFLTVSSEQSAESIHPVPRGKQVINALAEGYPERIKQVEYRDDDWALLLDGIWFYYAEGRMLPEHLRKKYADYDSIPFYMYPAELPEWEAPDAETGERYRRMQNRRRENPPKRSNYFLDTLWRSSSQAESYDRQKSIYFLGKQVLVHYSILEELSLVEETIKTAARTDSAVRKWITELNSVVGYNWRQIAETESRSYHSYGAAVDVLPKQYDGLATYWLWSAQSNPEWWAIPYEKRLHPPDAVIKAFESYGFVWGGKWGIFDTMHFEYRPEIMILSGFEVKK
ncbi:M15 family metallopeptidase [Brucepastera parasyntrophica]|uniref:M15 family metallopeptidase n=1 Tax=Brucepastera parasyntrophica TaxID=2880008 RepID=UPI00210E1CC3|nr:M15 family metallopeptidase [Brucepastera parasyntrophica]ULQ60234.1 M15 family metallopeptidase [Brucepastera parasyntrophica]